MKGRKKPNKWLVSRFKVPGSGFRPEIGRLPTMLHSPRQRSNSRRFDRHFDRRFDRHLRLGIVLRGWVRLQLRDPIWRSFRAHIWRPPVHHPIQLRVPVQFRGPLRLPIPSTFSLLIRRSFLKLIKNRNEPKSTTLNVITDSVIIRLMWSKWPDSKWSH